MKLSGLTVCVNYADLLTNGIENWLTGCDSLTIVTTPDDAETIALWQSLLARENCWLYTTNAFFENGAVFNKAAAISECVASCNWFNEWQLLFDADIIPPTNWRKIIEKHGLQCGNLYGAKRQTEGGMPIVDCELAGFFQLFHATDPRVLKTPLLDCSWRHGGGYDSEFQARWDANHRIILPLTVTHQGDPRKNWWGRWNQQAMTQMEAERRRTRQLAKNERMEVK